MSKGYDVLLVEDSELERYLFRRACASGGTRRLHEAADGEEALNFLYKRNAHGSAPTPHVIVLDLRLPKVSGLEVLRRIKLDENLRTIPVIVLTASPDPEDVEACYDLGASAFVEKPDQYQKFCDVLSRIDKFWMETAVLPRAAADARGAAGAG